MVITIVGHVATVSLGVKINGYAAICARLGARWTCRNRHQGKGPPERAHAGLGSTKPRYIVYTRASLQIVGHGGMCAAVAVRVDERGLGDSDEEGGEEGEEAAVAWQAAVRALLWSVYIPGTIRALGQQSLDPFVPLFAKRMGATVSEAGVVSSISFAANALCSPVAGILVANTGASCAMLLGVAINVGAALLGGLSPSVLGLSISRGLTGAGNGVFQVGRQVSLTNDVPNALRGRVQSLQVRL